MNRFGYLVPEFPGQTHAFFWRELKALTELGHQPEPVSTRHPGQAGPIPSWAHGRIPEIHYLVPPNALQIAGTALTALSGLRHLDELRAASGLQGSPLPPRKLIQDLPRKAALFLAGAALARHARTRGWTHIHVHSCADAAQVALFAHILSGIPYSLTLHGPLSDYGPNQSEKWRNAEFAIIITEQLLAEAQEHLNGSLPTTVKVAPMGVELSAFARLSPYKPWTQGTQAQIFSCGRLNPSKGHMDLLRALRRVVDSGVDAALTIAGEDEHGGTGYRTVLQQAITDLGLTRRVTLLGAIPEDRVRRELERTHLFALASLQEPLGVAIMEAMAMGVPVVATAAGGVPQLVTEGLSGLLVEPRQPAKLATAMVHILRNPAKAAEMGAHGRIRLESTFDVRQSASALSELMSCPN
ncbi:exopolysaccharide biosynthesis GT4 family glycosyltransferase EpsE [Paenarthrobacter sp. 4246]|uniref:exopolysaccharide biosynthesis GT4 family glycosyltransferase EpsE n=1 Tax=Paenarthrobacter sp. 4246 TaxID=3156456 RepID=UPI003399AE59